MDINNSKYGRLIGYIKGLYDDGEDWENIREVKFAIVGETAQESFSNLSLGPVFGVPNLTLEDWYKLVDYVKEKEEPIKTVKLGKNIRNHAKISTDSYSAWQLYKQNLVTNGFSDKSIRSIELSTIDILQSLSVDAEKDGPVKGLVVGNVQSGKTANMAALMAMAADNGFNYFIVLSGVIENLRQQTATRLYNDMNASGNGNLHWHQVNNPSIRSRDPEHNISGFHLNENDTHRYFTVGLKNSTRLKNLTKWLLQDKNKAKQLKILIIDDEADQASINTKDIEGEESTVINRLIKDLANEPSFKSVNYIAYTATPFANVLNESGEESLYPRDFIKILDTSEDYIGPEQIFGITDPERSAALNIVRSIPDIDREIITDIQKNHLDEGLPNSFKKSIHWFLLTVASLRVLEYKKPISMLVHTSFKIVHHEIIANKIANYLKYIQENYMQVLPELELLYKDEKIDFSHKSFLDEMPEYSSPDAVPKYPSWDLIREQLDRLMRLSDEEYVSHIPVGNEGQPQFHKGFHLVIDNSKSRSDNQIVRLVYPTKSQMPALAPAFIVVGGNTLSRGLTLEGLTTTYFLRTTNQADTLMQMGRWFGFRKGYEIFPRVWLDRLAQERYVFLTQMNDEMKNEIQEFAENGLTPAEYALRVKYSPNQQFIRVTANNKSQNAKPVAFDFNGFNSQTILFEDDASKLNANLENTSIFLNILDQPKIKSKYMIWENVATETVKDYLEKYQVYEKNSQMANLPALIKWLEKNQSSFSDWSVVLVSKGDIEDSFSSNSDWNIHGYSPGSVTRSRLESNSTKNIASIGALRGPTDLLADINVELQDDEKNVSKPNQIKKIRSKYGYDKVPQLLIYRIDKDSQPVKGSKNRLPLNISADAIGINVMLPGSSQKTHYVEYIATNLADQIDESEFEEEND